MKNILNIALILCAFMMSSCEDEGQDLNSVKISSPGTSAGDSAVETLTGLTTLVLSMTYYDDWFLTTQTNTSTITVAGGTTGTATTSTMHYYSTTNQTGTTAITYDGTFTGTFTYTAGSLNIAYSSSTATVTNPIGAGDTYTIAPAPATASISMNFSNSTSGTFITTVTDSTGGAFQNSGSFTLN
jgi:hypothetical protein